MQVLGLNSIVRCASLIVVSELFCCCLSRVLAWVLFLSDMESHEM